VVVHRSEDSTAQSGMPGSGVGVQELIDGEWGLWVETTAERAACAACGTWVVGQWRCGICRAGAPDGVVLVEADLVLRRWGLRSAHVGLVQDNTHVMAYHSRSTTARVCFCPRAPVQQEK
jgi:hypothetical protein